MSHVAKENLFLSCFCGCGSPSIGDTSRKITNRLRTSCKSDLTVNSMGAPGRSVLIHAQSSQRAFI